MSSPVNFYEIDSFPGMFHEYMDVMRYDLKFDAELYESWVITQTKKLRHHRYFLFDYMNQRSNFWETYQFNNDDKLIFDCSYEGWSYKECPIAQTIHKHFASKNHKLENIFFISGNFIERESYSKWCKENNLKDQINIVEICSWDTSGYLQYAEEIDYLERRLIRLENIRKNFIYLSRRARPYRTLLTKMLYDNNLLKDNVISHSNVPENYYDSVCLNDIDFTDFDEKLPIIADTKDFETNWANFLNEEVHLDALFSVVGETLQDNYNNTSLFFSEKTFRSMYLGMPFLIWGQYGCNNFLFRKMKYKPYTAWFDYEFDNIEDNKQRCIELVKQLTSLNRELNSMTKTQRIDWATKDMDTLRYNRTRTKYNQLSLGNFKVMLEKLNG